MQRNIINKEKITHLIDQELKYSIVYPQFSKSTRFYNQGTFIETLQVISSYNIDDKGRVLSLPELIYGAINNDSTKYVYLEDRFKNKIGRMLLATSSEEILLIDKDGIWTTAGSYVLLTAHGINLLSSNFLKGVFLPSKYIQRDHEKFYEVLEGRRKDKSGEFIPVCHYKEVYKQDIFASSHGKAAIVTPFDDISNYDTNIVFSRDDLKYHPFLASRLALDEEILVSYYEQSKDNLGSRSIFTNIKNYEIYGHILGLSSCNTIIPIDSINAMPTFIWKDIKSSYQ